jgi:peptidoglycan hydrolase-like protein with peptidoglycan-binding domain
MNINTTARLVALGLALSAALAAGQALAQSPSSGRDSSTQPSIVAAYSYPSSTGGSASASTGNSSSATMSAPGSAASMVSGTASMPAAMSASGSILSGGDVSFGMRGSAVAELQGILIELGYLKIPRGVALGYFGPLTRAALTAYQRAFDLSTTGSYDAATRANLLSWLSNRGFVSSRGGSYSWAYMTGGNGSQGAAAGSSSVSMASAGSGSGAPITATSNSAQMPLSPTGYWYQGSWYASLPGAGVTAGTNAGSASNGSNVSMNAGIPGYWQNNVFYSLDGSSVTVYGTPNPTSQGQTGYWYNGTWYQTDPSNPGYGYFSTR